MPLEIITSGKLAPFRHGFFTRKGGISSGIYAGLNCGPGSGDQRDCVQTNRRMVSDALGIDASGLVSVHQVHSDKVLVVDGSTSVRDTRKPRADAMVSRVPGAALGILTADCQPVLFADRNARVIGAAHAGWKGALNGVLEATIEAMERLGAVRADISAVIGPSIGPIAYEVGPEFRQTFLNSAAENSRFFTDGKGDRYMFDLPGFGLARLRAAGLSAVEWTGHCTFSDPQRFYSYRRSTHEGATDYGRLISVIVC